MAVKFSNNFSTFLSGGITASDTTITLQSVSGLPTLGSGDYTYLTIDSDTVSPTLEIVKVTAVNTGTGEVTVTRAQDGTTASSFSSGAKVELRLTAILLNDVSDEASTTDWPDVLNKPDPTLTITGDITGSATFTDLASASLTATASADLLRVDGDGSDLTDVRAETVEVTVKNVSGGSLAKGTPVHQTGTSGSSTFEVVAANASSASLMPAHFVLLETLADQAEGRGLLMGRISGVDTSGFSEGDTIYVAAGGGYTNVAPTGEGNLIQNLGTVTRVDSTNGGGEVMGAGRSAATPNLNQGNIFLGNASNQAATASLSTSVANLSHYNNSDWDTAFSWGDHSVEGYLTGNQTITLSGDVSGSGTTSIVVTVADDSHNHVISNVDGLQAALDTKYESGDSISVANITATGYLRGPSTFTIDPATHGDDTGTVVIAGNLQIDGTTTTVNSTTVTIDDLNLTLASGAATASAANGAGITVDGASATILYNSAGDEWQLNKPLTVTGEVAATGGNSSNWNTAYGWGGHSTAGYLTSFTETDPVFTASAASGIATADITNWNTAYGWGDHAGAGYLTANQTITLSGDVSGSGTTSIVVTVADDSHNHTIANVDGLQTALDNAGADVAVALAIALG